MAEGVEFKAGCWGVEELYLFFGITVQTRGFVILTTEGRKDLSFIETLALRHRLRRVERFTLDRSFVAGSSG